MKATSEPGLVELRMSARPHVGKCAPDLPGKFYKLMLEKPPFDVLVPDPVSPAASSSYREPFVLMHMPKPREQTRVAVPEPTTAVDAAAQTPTDAPPTPPLAAGSETTPERPASPEEVTGLIERLSLAGAASNSDGGEGGGGAACAKCGIHSAALKNCARCQEVAYCGKE